MAHCGARPIALAAFDAKQWLGALLALTVHVLLMVISRMLRENLRRIDTEIDYIRCLELDRHILCKRPV
jgi:hypothetical protein